MAYDEGLAERIRDALSERDDVVERKMFGGLAFMLSGNMSVGIVGDELMVRVGSDAYESSLARPHARKMDFTGRAMKGMVYVATAGFEADSDLHAWIDRGLAFASSLPPK